MGVVIELSETEMPRYLPPPEFSAPFASPSLRWGRKKRLRCFSPAAAAAAASVRVPPDSCRSLSPASVDGPHKHASSSPTRNPPPPPPPPHPWARCAPSPSPLLPPPSACPRGPIRLTDPGEDGGEGTSAPPPPDLSSGAPAETLEARDEGSRPGGGALGWSLRSRARGGGGSEEGKRKKRKVELWVALSKDEIELDFLWMTGAKPPRRSMRRSKSASNQLQGIFPGSWLPSKITADRYRVSEPSDCRKG